MQPSNEGPGDLATQTAKFGADLWALLDGCLESVPPMAIEHIGNRSRIFPQGQTDDKGGIPLRAAGETLAWLRLSIWCCPDSYSQWLAVHGSKVWVTSNLDRTPIIRYEYLRDSHSGVPLSHVQVHAHRGSMSHLLTKTGHAEPHDISALHLPTGGARFRPSVEDVLQFLIWDCKVDAKDGWQAAVEKARTDFRRSQLKAAVRATPADAASALRRLGYSVTPPTDGDPPDNPSALTVW